jgi:protoheme IX farnesyltransferase
MFDILRDFFKANIVVFVIISALVGYGIGYRVEMDFSFPHLLSFLVGLFFLSAGSLSLNQVQEWKFDVLMPRTNKRPIPDGKLSPKVALCISLSFLACGLSILWFMKPLTFYVGVASVISYNGLYTLWWKRNMAFAAIPGAVPGALPVTLGYSIINDNIFSSESIYLFLVMFIWQMPHFWALAIKFKGDYTQGGFPVLPAVVGSQRTQYHIALWTFVYAGIAIASPYFVSASYAYLLVVVPFCIKLLWEFKKYFSSADDKKWLPFFLWTTFSIIVFLAAPLIDRWVPFVTGQITL